MRHNAILLSVSVGIALAFGLRKSPTPKSPCAAAASLISQGDGKDKVRHLCGEPSDVSIRGYVRRAPVYEYG